MAQKKRLSDAHSVLNSFRALVKALRLADRAGLKAHGLGSAQLYVLHELNRESPVSINELAERTATDQSTVSVVASKLIAKGFVTSNRAADDARRAELTLTTKGRRLLRNLPPPIQHLLIEGVERLPRARARALAEGLHEICRLLGINDEHPPMLLTDEPAARSVSRAKKPAAKRRRNPAG